MARTEIVAVDQLPHAINNISFAAGDAANGMFFKNNGFRKVIVKTGASASTTLTIKSVTDNNRRTGDIVITLGASEVWESSFFEQALFNNGGNVDIDIVSDTDVEIAVVNQKLN